ncbi:MAG: baseplate J/gp47 family protein [Ktedonobacteraceae bacterium]
MYQVTDEPVETLHLYVVRDDDKPPAILPIALSLLSLVLVLAVGVLFPYRPPLVTQTVSVPTLLLPLQTFTTTAHVIPTGVQTFPARHASGVLTITNGSVIAQHFPAGMIFTSDNGVEVVTTASVDVPAGDGTSYGTADVPVQAVLAGVQGNIAALTIQQVYGTALYMKNERDFTGGRDSYSTVVMIPQDRATALAKAHATLAAQTFAGLFYRPCMEHVTGTTSLSVTWTCQFFTYTVPSLPHVRVLHVQVVGKTVFLAITYAPRPKRLETK